jgi:hypothetical protein
VVASIPSEGEGDCGGGERRGRGGLAVPAPVGGRLSSPPPPLRGVGAAEGREDTSRGEGAAVWMAAWRGEGTSSGVGAVMLGPRPFAVLLLLTLPRAEEGSCSDAAGRGTSAVSSSSCICSSLAFSWACFSCCAMVDADACRRFHPPAAPPPLEE